MDYMESILPPPTLAICRDSSSCGSVFVWGEIMRDNNTGQFLKTPIGSKTPKMLEVEKYLSELEGKNTTLEEDYKKYYIEKGWGQKRLADRWRASRGHIFGSHMKDGRQSWVKILSLTKRNATTSEKKKTNTKYIC